MNSSVLLLPAYHPLASMSVRYLKGSELLRRKLSLNLSVRGERHALFLARDGFKFHLSKSNFDPDSLSIVLGRRFHVGISWYAWNFTWTPAYSTGMVGTVAISLRCDRLIESSVQRRSRSCGVGSLLTFKWVESQSWQGTHSGSCCLRFAGCASQGVHLPMEMCIFWCDTCLYEIYITPPTNIEHWNHIVAKLSILRLG